MPNGLSHELIQLLYMLLPGFIAAWVFYGLSAHPKSGSQFERIIQALIYSVIIHAMVIIVSVATQWVGSLGLVIGDWNEASVLIWSVAIAFVFGLLLARFANNDCIHRILRGKSKTHNMWLGWLRGPWTTRTSHPSEWFSVFRQEQRWVVLHLRDGRRLYGWPYEWPDHCDRGQFVIEEPRWLLDTKCDGVDEQAIRELPQVRYLLIAASDVELVEFLNFPEEVQALEQRK